MKGLAIIIFVSLLKIIHTAYNPIPNGVVIISSRTKVSIMQPTEFGGNDVVSIIYKAPNDTTIVSSAYDPIVRSLYILYTTEKNSTLYLSQLVSIDQLDASAYQLPITFDIANINKLNTFTADITNRRIFLTDQTGTVQVFSMSGLMINQVSIPSLSNGATVRSVVYNNALNRLFIATDRTLASCTGLDINKLQCCEGPAQANDLGLVTFDQIVGNTLVYALADTAGIYQVTLNDSSCPTTVAFRKKLGNSANLQFVIYHGLYFVSASATNGQDNSYLYIANQTSDPRYVSVSDEIVALHVSYPVSQSTSTSGDTCFHGISYNLYRAAVILAAIFGTIMGIFMCFNVLFCIDFVMTKNIIRGLKQQIPHNLMEDRWNKLVEEKYARLALERERKKDDPPPRKPSFAPRKTSSAATASSSNNNAPTTDNSVTTTDSLQVPKPISNISDYLRRKSESYFNRSRSVDYRASRAQGEEQFTDPRRQRTATQVQIEPVEEENETRGKLRQNLSRKELLKGDDDFL